MTMPSTPVRSKQVVLGLAGSLVLSVLYDAIPNHWFEEEFDRLRLPRAFRGLFVLSKSSAVAGLLIGLRSPKLGRLTARALIVYFVVAIGAHARVRDKPVRYVPAVVMVTWSVLAARIFSNLSQTLR
jgi:hypothetical protein